MSSLRSRTKEDRPARWESAQADAPVASSIANMQSNVGNASVAGSALQRWPGLESAPPLQVTYGNAAVSTSLGEPQAARPSILRTPAAPASGKPVSVLAPSIESDRGDARPAPSRLIRPGLTVVPAPAATATATAKDVPPQPSSDAAGEPASRAGGNEERRPGQPSGLRSAPIDGSDGAARPAAEHPASAEAPASAGQLPSADAAASLPELDRSSAEGLLSSLAGVSPSAFPSALREAKASAPEIRAREKGDLQAGFPQVDRPTGLPSQSVKRARAPTELPPATAPNVPAEAGRPAGPADTAAAVAIGPTPGTELSVATSEPAAESDSGGSWWDWLVGRVRGFLGRLPTTDSGLSTSAGPRPAVDLTGDANAARNDQLQQASGAAVANQAVQADVATTTSLGETSIYPDVPPETLVTSYQPTPPGAGTPGGALQAPSLPADATAEFDQTTAPQLNKKVSEQVANYHQDESEYQQRTAQTQAEGERRIAKETERTRTEQEGWQQQARAEVDAGRARWREDNRAIEDKFASQSQAKRGEIDQQISEKVQATETQADRELTGAETRAADVRAAAETRAAAEKAKAESQPRSWWERFKGAVSDAFAAIKKVVSDIFDALRKAVKTIIDLAKTVVHGLIEAARAVIVGIIKTFGEVIKTFVTIALFAFPEAAAKARAWIDGKVDGAVDAVNQAAEALKEAAEAILDWVAAGLDAALSALQEAMTFALDVLEFLALGFLTVLELLAKLQNIIVYVVPMIERIIAIIKDPTPVIEGIKAFIGGMIAQVPAMAVGIARGAITFSEPPVNHWDGIWSHLEPKLRYLGANWWTVIKQTLWHMVWPFAEDSPLWKDASDFWKTIKLAWADISAGNTSRAIDDILRVIQLANNIIGLFYGWVALGLIAGFAIAGGVAAAPAGVVPGIIAGAAAGAGIAGTVGMYLAVAALAIEGSVLAKAGYNLIFRTQTEDENEADYERVAGSGLTVAIIGAMFAIGWLAKALASAIIEAVFGRVFGRPALRGRGTTARGDVIEIRVALATRVLALMRGRNVTWLEVIRRNFPVIDLLEDGVITITQRPKRAPLYRITGGRLISVKSSVQTGAALRTAVEGWVDELANFNTRGNVSVVNPSGRSLVIALQTPVDAATEAAMRLQASGRGVDLQLTTALPPGHPAGVFPDQIPAILSEAGVSASNEVADDTKDDKP